MMKRFITMKWVFASIFLGLIALSVIAWRVQPRAAAPGKVPLTWVSDSNPLRAEQVDLFNRSNPRYELKVDPSNNDLEKVIVQCIGGVGPDLFDCSDGYQLAAFVRSGVAMDLTEELKKRGIDVPGRAFRGILGNAMLDGHVYGVPTNIAADGTWFHKDFFDAAGIPYPKGQIKWDAMIRLAQRLTLHDSQGRVTRFGLLLPWWNWRHIFDGFGAGVFNADGTKCILDRPEAIAAVRLMHDVVYRYHISPSPSDEAGMTSQGGFGSGDIGLFGAKRIAMAIGGRWWLSELRKIPNLKLGVFESPYESVRMFRGYGRATLVNRRAKNPHAAIDFLAYLASGSYGELISKQADGIPAFRNFAEGHDFLHDPAHPEEDYNAVWRDISEHSVADQVSPFVDGNLANQILQKQFDLIQNNIKSPDQAMADAARNINAEIRRNLGENPALAERYRNLVGR